MTKDDLKRENSTIEDANSKMMGVISGLEKSCEKKDLEIKSLMEFINVLKRDIVLLKDDLISIYKEHFELIRNK